MSLKWSRNPAGYLPGQSQHLTVSFSSRDKNEVVVKYKFSAISLGEDDYAFNQRHNKLIIYFTYKNTSGEEVTVKETYNYQAQGYCAHRSTSGSLILKNVANGETSIKVAVANKRIWVNAPSNSWDPRSTGVVDKTSAGTLTIEEAKKYDVNFYKDNKVAKVSNLPVKYDNKYAGTKINAPKSVKDDNNYYVCTGFTTSARSDTAEANLKTPTVKLGESITITGDHNYYATWKRQTYKYIFYKSNSFKQRYTTSTDFAGTTNPIVHTYDKPTLLPNLEKYNKGPVSTNPSHYFSDYYKEGYTFKGWDCSKGFYKAGERCNISSNVYFYPRWEAKKIDIKFDYCFNDKVKMKNYEYGNANFDFSSLIMVNDKASNTLFRPGYKLVGWSFKKPEKIYNPFETTNSDIDYKYNYTGKIKYPDKNSTLGKQLYNKDIDKDGLTLYAVWEYYTTCYVYAESDDKWHLAIPYVYTNNKWHITLSYVNTNNKWKL